MLQNNPEYVNNNYRFEKTKITVQQVKNQITYPDLLKSSFVTNNVKVNV